LHDLEIGLRSGEEEDRKNGRKPKKITSECGTRVQLRARDRHFADHRLHLPGFWCSLLSE
jgi:hypothetical protein